MGRELRIESPNQRQKAGERVACISGNCCDPATWSFPWDMDCIRCIFCPDDKALMDHARENCGFWSYDDIYYDDPYFDGTEWTTRRFPGGGQTYKAANGLHVVFLLTNVSCEEAADTIYHELWHTKQPPGMTSTEAENDAYYNTELWTIRKGLPGRPGYRTTDEFGNVVVDREAISGGIADSYPGQDSGDGWVVKGSRNDPPRTIEQNHLTGETRVRPSREGDSYFATETQTSGEKYIDPAEFYCE